MTLTYGSLFSGIGGFDLGFDRAGMQCAWQVEYDDKARSVLQCHWPDVPKYEDVRNVGRNNLRPVDVICGGFPCQDVSVAGKRAGLAGERSGLWSEFSRIIGELTPAWVVIENVPGLLSSNDGRDMGYILWQLAELGYGWAYRVLDSQYFGVAQRRRRVFIVGHLRTSGERAGAVLFEPESLPWHPAPRRKAGQRAAGTLAARTNGGGFPGTDEAASGYDVAAGIAQPLRSGRQYSDMGDGQANVFPVVMAHGQANAEFVSDGSPSLTNNHEQPIVFEPRYTRNGRGAPDTVVPPLKAQSGQSGKGDAAPVVAYNIQHNDGGQHRRKDRPEGGLYVNETETALTVGTTDMTAVIASGVRRLMPIECERLQGFPDGWTAGQSDSARYRQLGNAVTVNVSEWIGRRIVEAAA